MAVSKISWLPPPSKLNLSNHDVHVWRVKLHQTDGRVQQLQQILSNDEQRRSERFYFDRDRRRFIVSHGVLRLIIGDYTDMAPSRVQFNFGHLGKPYISNMLGHVRLQFNLARSNEIALYAFTCNREIGIDVEYVRDMLDFEKIALNTFSSLENKMLKNLPEYQRQEAFFHCWVRKEAYIKAIGKGLSHDLKKFDVTLATGEPARLVSVEGSAEQASCWFMKTLIPEDGYVAALATKGSDFCLSYWEYP